MKTRVSVKKPNGFDFVRFSIIKCPRCGFSKKETMPLDSCQFFYECSNCKIKLKPKPGDCCVFCSYGSIKCSSKEEEKNV